MTDAAPAWLPEKPHNQLPALPPAHELESRAVLKACIEARTALAELIPNQAMLINTIPLLEAKDSSEIENIVTTTDQLFQYAQGHENADPATKEALRHRTALHQGFQSLKARPLCTATAVDVCRTLKGVDMDIGGVATLEGFEPPQGELKLPEFEERWTGGYIFENEWQSFRTRQSRDLELTTAQHTYDRAGRYMVAIKVIDIFGNDTMTLVPVNVG